MVRIPDLHIVDGIDTVFSCRSQSLLNDTAAPWTLFISNVEIERVAVLNLGSCFITRNLDDGIFLGNGYGPIRIAGGCFRSVEGFIFFLEGCGGSGCTATLLSFRRRRIIRTFFENITALCTGGGG